MVRLKTEDASSHNGMAARGACIMVIFLVVWMGTAGCVVNEPTPKDSSKVQPITVAVTILPQKQFVERIGGENVRVIVLVPPGASPHTHEPTPGQMAEVSTAALYFKVGSGIEFERAWMDKISGVNPGMPIIDSSEGVALIQGGDEEDAAEGPPEQDQIGLDPHIWLSPRNAKVMVEHTFEGLVGIDPGNETQYRANKEQYLKELDALDADISKALSEKVERRIMVYHPAWTYLARDYNLTQIPVELEGKEPTPKGLESLIRQAKESNITVVFASPEFSTKSAEVVAQEIDGKVVLVSSLSEDYLENMRKVATAFAQE